MTWHKKSVNASGCVICGVYPKESPCLELCQDTSHLHFDTNQEDLTDSSQWNGDWRICKEQPTLCQPTSVMGQGFVALSSFVFCRAVGKHVLGSGLLWDDFNTQGWCTACRCVLYHKIPSLVYNSVFEVCLTSGGYLRKNFSRKKKKKGTVKEKYLVSGVAGGSSQAQKGQEPHGNSRAGLITCTLTQTTSYSPSERNQLLRNMKWHKLCMNCFLARPRLSCFLVRPGKLQPRGCPSAWRAAGGQRVMGGGGGGPPGRPQPRPKTWKDQRVGNGFHAENHWPSVMRVFLCSLWNCLR